MNAVAVAVSRMKVIETIKLNGNGFSSDGMKSLTEVLKLSATIKCLEVSSYQGFNFSILIDRIYL
jgi:hypothetical protein